MVVGLVKRRKERNQLLALTLREDITRRTTIAVPHCGGETVNLLPKDGVRRRKSLFHGRRWVVE